MKSGGRWRTAGILTLVVFLLAVLGGCGGSEEVQDLKDRFGGQEPSLIQSTDLQGQLTEELPQETVDVVLYFSDPTGLELVAETRSVPKVVGIGRATIEELISGPRVGESELLPTIPVGTQLRDINIKPDGLARVDFSRELIDNHLGGSAAENLTVYSIVNTLSQFPTVNEVQLLVEGQFIDTLVGHVDVSKPLLPNSTMVFAR